MENSFAYKQLTDATNPDTLLKWMDKHIRYNGVNKGKVYTAEEVVKNGLGHCLETVDLERAELTRLGYECKILYMENLNCQNIHTALFYRKNGEAWLWFEWTWSTYRGINGPYLNLKHACNRVMEKFTETYGDIVIARIGFEEIKKGMSENDYIKMIRKWVKPPGYIGK